MERRAVREFGTIDENVIQACQLGDMESFRLLFEAYKDRVYSIAIYFFNGNEASARDATQQVFLKLITKVGQFRRDAEFATWLHRLTVNVCIDEKRKWRRFLPFGESWISERASMKSEEERHARIEIADSVRAAIAELKPKLRMTVLLKYVEGLSYDEIAAALNCSKGTVASRLNRGHKILARKLGHLRQGELQRGYDV